MSDNAIERKLVTTELLTPDQVAEAERRAAELVITGSEQIPGIGAAVQRKLATADHQIEGVQAKDLSVVGDALIDLRGGLTSLDARQFLVTQPTAAQKVIESVGFLRKWFGVLQRLVRGYEKALVIIEQRAAATESHVSGLVIDVATKKEIIKMYQQSRDELLIWAKVAEVKLAQLKAEEIDLRNKPQTSDTNIQLAEYAVMIPTMAHRVDSLTTFADLVDQQAMEMMLGSLAETMLINSMRSALEIQVSTMKSTVRKVLSALRTRKAIEISQANRRTTEVLLQQGSSIAMVTVGDATLESMHPVVAIGVLQAINKQFIDTVEKMQKDVAESEAKLREHKTQVEQLMRERSTALG